MCCVLKKMVNSGIGIHIYCKYSFHLHLSTKNGNGNPNIKKNEEKRAMIHYAKELL